MSKRVASAILFFSLGCLIGSSTVVLADQEKVSEAPDITPLELAALRESGCARISEVEAPNGVALYCMMGPRARKGEAALLEAGYASIHHLDGGLAAWKAADLPVKSGSESESGQWPKHQSRSKAPQPIDPP
ncbi:MAG: rhodanese-like domain-containing protein [Myxococcales bacterium]